MGVKMDNINPKVFISYSHDNKSHQDRVLEFSNKLRSEGIDCILDQYEDSPSEGWPRWMERNIQASDFVLLVCTEKFNNHILGKSDESGGKGISWESNIIYQIIYNDRTNNKKFIPVLFKDCRTEFIPIPIQGSTYYNIEDSAEYDKLYWRLRGVKVEKPELGKLRGLPLKERKTLFITGLIEPELWDKAEWDGIVFAYDNRNTINPPKLALRFKNEKYAIQIFENWIKKLGYSDPYNELRISLIEVITKGVHNGYWVHIGSYAENAVKRYESQNEKFNFDFITIVSRMQKMHFTEGPKGLNYFKSQYNLKQAYCLIPAIHKNSNTGIINKFKLFKNKIEFRKISDIKSPSDLDYVVLKAINEDQNS
jgi:hypothetical protein